MSLPDSRLRDFHFDGGWAGVAYVPFWRAELPIGFITYNHEFTPRMTRIVRAVLDYPHDLRPDVERGMFDHYQKHVFETIDFGDPEVERELAPPLATPDQIWKLIRGATIVIDEVCRQGHEGTVEFRLSFSCSWLVGHLLGVEFRDWEIVDINGR